MIDNYNPFSLEGKSILVTGASSGIGKAIAVECSRMGAKVILTARNEERLNQVLSELAGQGHQTIKADLTKDEDIEALVEQLTQLDGVVHNAGVGNRVIAKMAKRGDIDFVMNPNVYAPILLQKQILKKKKINKSSSIVFIASRAPFAPSVGNSLYAASKGAILGYAKVLGLELAPQKIRVNSILPAMVWTELVAKDAEMTGGNYEDAQAKYPLKRYGNPEDIAYLAVYMLSDASSWMTGSTVDITGGGEGSLVL